MPVSPESEIGIAYGQGRTAADALALPTTNPYSDATLLGKQQRASWFQGYYDAIRDQNIRILQSGLAFLIAGGFVVPAGSPISIGSGGGSISQQAEGTPDQTGFWTGAVSNAILIAEEADKTFDFAHPPQSNPTLFVHSANQSTSQWISLSHDGVNGLIQTGAGSVKFEDKTFGNSPPAILFSGGMAIHTQSSPVMVIGTTVTGYVQFASNQVAIAVGGQFGWSSSTVFAAGPDTGLGRHAQGVIKATNGSSLIRGLFGGGAAVASAAALPVPTGSSFHVTGTTTITSITSTNFGQGAQITMIFDGAITVTNGGNIFLAGGVNFVATANDTLTLVFDGTNWYEVCRSVN